MSMKVRVDICHLFGFLITDLSFLWWRNSPLWESLGGGSGFASSYRSRERPASLSPCPPHLGRVRHGSQSGTGFSCGTAQHPGTWDDSEEDPVTGPTTASNLVLTILSTLWPVQCSSIISFFWWIQPESVSIVGCKELSLDLSQIKRQDFLMPMLDGTLDYQYV